MYFVVISPLANVSWMFHQHLQRVAVSDSTVPSWESKVTYCQPARPFLVFSLLENIYINIFRHKFVSTQFHGKAASVELMVKGRLVVEDLHSHWEASGEVVLSPGLAGGAPVTPVQPPMSGLSMSSMSYN